jgi:hypothetical protein
VCGNSLLCIRMCGYSWYIRVFGSGVLSSQQLMAAQWHKFGLNGQSKNKKTLPLGFETIFWDVGVGLWQLEEVDFAKIFILELQNYM